MTVAKKLMFYGGDLSGKTLEVGGWADRYIHNRSLTDQAHTAMIGFYPGPRGPSLRTTITVPSPMAFADSTVPPKSPSQHPQEYIRRVVAAVSPARTVKEECFVHYTWAPAKVLLAWNSRNGDGALHHLFPIPEVLTINASGVIAWIGYDDLYQTLDVCLGARPLPAPDAPPGSSTVVPEKVFRYFGVPTKEVFRLLAAESKGRHFNDVIKPKYGPSVPMEYTPWQLTGA